MTLAHGAGSSSPGRAEPLAQRGELTGYRAIGGDRARLHQHRDDLARAGTPDLAAGTPGGVPGGQDVFGLQDEEAFTGLERHPFGRWGFGLAAGRDRRSEREPDQAGAVAGEVEPPGIGWGHG
jgi:hypothetical protein